MVRCGSCMQTFDARPGFIPDQPNPQLELPILVDTAVPAEEPVNEKTTTAEEAQQTATEEADAGEKSEDAPQDIAESMPEADSTAPAPAEIPDAETSGVEQPQLAATGIDGKALDEQTSPKAVVLQPAIPAQRPTGERRKKPRTPPKRRNWPWVVASLLLLLLACAQAVYFFRVEIAVRLPGLKPALVNYCKLLNCTVPLPRHTELMSIESSDMEANPTHENLITLNALLRNRAAYPQAFPNLELTLNDTQDKPLARRIFKPVDYLPPVENEATGLLPNHELSIKLQLDTTSLKPTGYRLVLFYPID